VTRIAPVLLSTETISVKVPPVSIPILSAGCRIDGFVGIDVKGCCAFGHQRIFGAPPDSAKTMDNHHTPSQSGFADVTIGIPDISA
jgi:hypothetical protein